ncbi:hypothetical protein Q5O14_04695 [Eubacteriaceae bacterium ES2]|nr:hypothetical protein Q5O14_04695 [Eubacteriaceae bacterium ES2]
MKYKAEIFDKVQYLYEETGFNDHQLHCVIRFTGKINEVLLRKATMLLLEAIPILSCRYDHNNGRDYWESTITSIEEVLQVVQEKTEFDNFTTSKVDELMGPQIKMCLYPSDQDALSIILNHMVCDAAGFKECLYVFSAIYSELINNPQYRPDFEINGVRSIEKILKDISFSKKLRSLLFNNSESNQDSEILFPTSADKNIFPFIITSELGPEKLLKIQEHCKKNDVTVNDVFLAAYYRLLYKKVNTNKDLLHIPIMVDMRRYSKQYRFDSLCNFSSTMIIQTPISPNENFTDTLMKISKEMNLKKTTDIGLNGFVQLSLIDKLLNNEKSYKLVQEKLVNPSICMTNIGVIEDQKLVFNGTNIKSAFICGSIKYRPHFQMALSSFKNTITLSSNLYGSQQDYETITDFLTEIENELPI